jgi:4-amino-4-deoxychorismate lyase
VKNNDIFLESIRIKNGVVYNLPYHLKRMNDTCRERFGEDAPTLSLDIPEDMKQGVVKCRVLYSNKIESIEFIPYTLPSISTFSFVDISELNIDYHLKYACRDEINALKEGLNKSQDIIMVRDGYVTDSSFANLVFTDGKRYVTPKQTLLPGTMRASLIDVKFLEVKPIRAVDVSRLFTHFTIINAMLPFGSYPLISIENIK